MTDKEIIIDSIDIRKCKHFEALYESRPNGFGGITIENYCYLYEDNCEKYPQCLYRSNQLQQLEAQLKREKQNSQEAIDTSIKEFNRAETLKTLSKRKEQECEELKERLESFQKDYSKLYQVIENKGYIKELNQLKAENEKLIRKITEIFACLIKANRSGIITDTIWVGAMTTLWDDIAQTLGIEGDQVQIEEQILQKISEGEQ